MEPISNMCAREGNEVNSLEFLNSKLQILNNLKIQMFKMEAPSVTLEFW